LTMLPGLAFGEKLEWLELAEYVDKADKDMVNHMGIMMAVLENPDQLKFVELFQSVTAASKNIALAMMGLANQRCNCDSALCLIVNLNLDVMQLHVDGLQSKLDRADGELFLKQGIEAKQFAEEVVTTLRESLSERCPNEDQ